jgi:hypothetical protein
MRLTIVKLGLATSVIKTGIISVPIVGLLKNKKDGVVS